MEDLGSNRIASQCDPDCVCASVLTMAVLGRVIECGSRSDGKAPRNDLTLFKVHDI